jgi:hypothetical protein
LVLNVIDKAWSLSYRRIKRVFGAFLSARNPAEVSKSLEKRSMLDLSVNIAISELPL